MRSSVLAAFVVIAAASAGCKKEQARPDGGERGAKTDAATGASGVPAPPPPPREIILGEVAPLTGDQASFGLSTHEGVMLAVNEVNAAGGVNGRPVVVHVHDDRGDPGHAAKLTGRLIAEDRATLILGNPTSAGSLAMAAPAQAAGVPMIAPSATHPKVTLEGDYIFRACFIDSFQGFVMAQFAREHLELKRVAVLRDAQSDYSNGLSSVFARKFSEMGGLIVGTESFAAGEGDFREQLRALKALKPEAIFVPAYYREAALIATQARELGLEVPLLGGDGWASDKLVELGGAAVDGSYFSNHYSPEDPSARVQSFVASYQRAYGGKTPDAIAALGYDAARLALDAARRAPDLSGRALRDELAATRSFPGVTGNISFDRTRNPMKPAVVVQIRDGKQRYVATVAP